MPADLQHLLGALADRYRPEREVGRGGMATVYLAHDLRHHRPVALKVLHPDLASALGPQRFLQEIKTTAGLDHPHILPLLDSGEAAGVLFYVTPYVEGGTLRDRLRRERQLPLDDALRITREVADALSHAHGRGVVHRDIKPENILLAEGHARVADFGIARAIASVGEDRLTATGIAVGTVAYMSPEQATGDPAVDGRSDIYSLATVLYEMLAGDPPFGGTNPQAILARKSLDPIPSLRTVRDRLPGGIERALFKALARVPADRFGTAAEFADALRVAPDDQGWGEWRSVARLPRALKRALAIGAPLVALALVGQWTLAQSRRRAEGLRSIAVLPCENLTRDASIEYIADRWTEEIILRLSRVTDMRVRPWLSVKRYKGTTLSPREIGTEVAAGRLLRCGVAQTSDSVRLDLQLISTDQDAIIWSGASARELSAASINDIQSEAARRIAEALGVGLSADQQAQLVRPPTRDLEALELYRRGRELLFMSTAETLPRSIEYFDRAIDRDSTFALAYAAKAEALWMVADAGIRDARETLPEIGRLARKALAIDEGLAEAHIALGVNLMSNWDWPNAEHELQRAIQLNPGSGHARMMYSSGLRVVDRRHDAIAEGRRAVDLDPADPVVHHQLALAYLVAGQHDRALAEARTAVDLDPRAPFGYLGLSLVFKAMGRHDSAIAAGERADQIYGGTPHVRAFLGSVLAAAGERQRARQILVEEQSPERKADPANLALVAAELGDFDQAIAFLERAYQERRPYLLLHMHWLPLALRADPRFKDLRRRAGFDRW